MFKCIETVSVSSHPIYNGGHIAWYIFIVPLNFSCTLNIYIFIFLLRSTWAPWEEWKCQGLGAVPEKRAEVSSLPGAVIWTICPIMSLTRGCERPQRLVNVTVTLSITGPWDQSGATGGGFGPASPSAKQKHLMLHTRWFAQWVLNPHRSDRWGRLR